MKEPRDVEALLAKARQPSEEALRLHPLYRGKLEVTPKCAIRGLDDFALWYTPGVAAPCRDIAQHPDRVFAHTNKGNFVVIVSDGTRVLGLGDIGPHAALPVMEGIAAAAELARCAEERGLSASAILPRLDEWEVVPRLAAAVECTAIAQGVASITATREGLCAKAAASITRAREETRVLMEHGLIGATASAQGHQALPLPV